MMKIVVFALMYLLDIFLSNLLAIDPMVFMVIGIFCAIKIFIYSRQGLNKILD